MNELKTRRIKVSGGRVVNVPTYLTCGDLSCATCKLEQQRSDGSYVCPFGAKFKGERAPDCLKGEVKGDKLIDLEWRLAVSVFGTPDGNVTVKIF
jgi:hypothetical protein